MGIISILSARPSRQRRRPLGKRGAIGVGFAVGATALLGMGALATEAGIWLTVRRNAQDAADAAAYAGTVRLALSGSGEATSAATQVVGRNGFTHTTTVPSAAGDTRVLVEVGFAQPANQTGGTVGPFDTAVPANTSPNAVRVQIWQVQRIGLAQLINRTAPVAWGGAVATIEAGGPACTLSIPPPGWRRQDTVNGQTNFEGGTVLDARNCLVASNYPGQKSINVQGNADVEVAGLRAAGQCYNCQNAETTGGYVSGAQPLDDPYAKLNDDSQNPLLRRRVNGNLQASFTRAAEQRRTVTIRDPVTGTTSTRTEITIPANTIPGATTFAAVEGSATNAGMNALQVGSNETLVLTPGTYYFYETSLRMSASSARIECRGCVRGGPGVTLVFTGNNANKVGGMDITGGQFELIAPGPSQGVPAVYDGIVIYRDDFGAVENQNVFNIRGNTGGLGDADTLFGGVYSPTGGFSFEGTPSVNMTTDPSCIAVVAAEITFTGTSTARIDACEANGTRVARVRYVRLVQ